MKVIVLMIIILFFAISVQAEETKPEENGKPVVYRDTQGNSLTLYTEPCPLKGWFAKWRLARWIWRGDKYEACWRAMLGRTESDTVISTVDSNGDVGRIPAVLFVEDHGV